MIGIILDILAVDNYYNISEEIEIAKGKYKLHTSLKKAIKQLKRNTNGGNKKD